ncbi:MAG: glycosyltransferase, partial [Firmicutes bacterium]|nr:glycosyltransferase [Bacillota bacterium]
MAEICSRVSILGVKIDNVTIGEAVQRIRAWIKAGGPHLVVTCNPEMVMTAAIDQLLAEILRRADLVVPDGIGVVWASRVLRRPVAERVPGIELMEAAL